MNDDILDFVLRTRRKLIVQALLRALGWGLALGWLTLALGRIAQKLLTGAERTPWLLALTAGLAAAGLVAWRERRILRAGRVALWIEEGFPQLRYALVTALEEASGPHAAPLRRDLRTLLQRAEAPLRQRMRRLLRRGLARILPALLLAALAQGAIALGWPEAWRSAPQVLAAPPATRIDRLANLTIELTPPAYTGWPPETLEDSDRIAALVGTGVVLRGPGGPQGIEARLGEAPALQAEEEGGGWRLAFVMPEAAESLTLSEDGRRRLLVLEPRADAAPQARLILPETDRMLSEAIGALELSARLSDDIGLTRGWFEIIVATGEGEGNSEFVESVAQETAFEAVDGLLRASLPLEGFGLQPGGQLSIRAAATDGNDVSGPGVGYSETRTIRLARSAQESEAVVNPAPPAMDESLMSLRMLIRDAERLDARRPEMEREAFAAEAAPLSRHADVIRDKVQGLADEARNDGAFEVPPLLEVALEAMWEGARDMAVAETGEALPHLRRAYEALQALSNMTRYFFRGEALPAIADVERVRMTGEEPVAAGPRSARPREETPRDRLAARLAALRGQAIAADDLTLLRVEALREAPEAAPLLEQALQDLRGGGAPDAALARLRVLLEGAPSAFADLPRWSPMPGARP